MYRSTRTWWTRYGDNVWPHRKVKHYNLTHCCTASKRATLCTLDYEYSSSCRVMNIHYYLPSEISRWIQMQMDTAASPRVKRQTQIMYIHVHVHTSTQLYRQEWSCGQGLNPWLIVQAIALPTEPCTSTCQTQSTHCKNTGPSSFTRPRRVWRDWNGCPNHSHSFWTKTWRE